MDNLKTYEQYGRRSIYEILSLDSEQAYNEYRAIDIDKVVIDENVFTNYGAYSFIWEKTFVKQPQRSASGSIGNLNSYATFLTPHLILDFSVMSIDDYRAIMRMHYEKNEFIVKCYDPIYNETITVKMYFGTEEMAKLHTISRVRLAENGVWEDWVELAAVNEYKVELIGTNNAIDTISVIYHKNPPITTGEADSTIGEEDIYIGEEIVIGASASAITSETFNGLYKFKHWNTTSELSDKNVYVDGQAYTINNDLVLYAQWDSATSHILSYNYGLGDPDINEESYTYITNRTVVQGQSIGVLPDVPIPKVKYTRNGVENTYTPYYNGKWYKTPVKASNSVPISNNALYWLNRDSTIYLLYDVMSYTLKLYIDGKLYQTNSIGYNTPINLPSLVQSGKTFDGWYSTPDFVEGSKVLSNSMPPFDLTLYARWV